MCGRSSLTKTEKEIEDRFDATFYSDELERYNPIPNYNIGPTQYTPIITSQNANKLKMAHWGLILSWSKDMHRSAPMINARMETILQTNSFKSLVSNQRCIVPFDGYYEWKKIGKKLTIPYRITWKQQKLFSMAGLWDQWINDNDEIITSFTILTMSAPPFLHDLHHRIPAILTPEKESLWLESDVASDADQLSLVTPIDEEYIEYYTISRKVNNVRNNDCSLFEEIEYNDPGEQLSLF